VVVGSALGTAWGKYAWDSYLVVQKCLVSDVGQNLPSWVSSAWGRLFFLLGTSRARRGNKQKAGCRVVSSSTVSNRGPYLG